MAKYKDQISEIDIEIIKKIERITGYNPSSFYGLVELIRKFG